MSSNKSLELEAQRAIYYKLLQQRQWREARNHLIPFCQQVDPEVAKWYGASHLQQIAAKLELADKGDIKRLAISLGPRHWKSSLTSEKFAAWYLGRHPRRSIILASHNVTLAQKFSRTVRDLISSNAEYRKIFPNTILKTDNIDDWLLMGGSRSSFRVAGVNTGIAGYGAHLIIVDDLFGTYEQAASETYRENAWNWYRGILRGRLEPNGIIVLVNSRWHESDTIGKLIEAEKEAGGEHYTIINIPVWDPLTQKYLWEERWSPAEYENLRAAVGEAVWRTQYEGQPQVQEGNLIKRPWFEYVPQLPEGVRENVRAYDLAIKLRETQKSDPDYTAEVSGAFFKQILYLTEPMLYRSEVPEITMNIVAYKFQHPWVRIAMAKSLHETTASQFLVRQGVGVEQYPERGDIVARATNFIRMASQGRIKLVGTPQQWEPFMAQWTAFPNGAHDDAVAVVAGLNYVLGIDQPFEDSWSETNPIQTLSNQLLLDAALRKVNLYS